MPSAPTPPNEGLRLAALRDLNLLDTAPDAAFDAITAAASDACGVPIALISLVDEERQWFKSKVGLCVDQTHRDHAFCAYAIHGDQPLIITDATTDPRTRDNPLVLGEPHIRFYAGAPLINEDGFALGTLCVIDTVPRDLTDAQLTSLTTLAGRVVELLNARRQQVSTLRAAPALNKVRAQLRHAVLATFALSMIATGVATVGSYRAAINLAHQRYDQLSERTLEEISRRVNLPVYGLKGACGVYAASQSVRRDEFADYVASRDLAAEFPGALGVGCIAPVRRDELDTFIAKERVEGAPDFNVRPVPGTTSTGDDLYVVRGIYPIGENARVWGTDLGSEPTRRLAIEQAIRTGMPTITGRIDLMYLDRPASGFLYLVPVYRAGTQPTTEVERVRDIDVVVYAPVCLDVALAGIADSHDGMLSISLYDGDHPDESTRMFDDRIDATKGDTDFASVDRIIVGGRTWAVQTFATPRFLLSIDWGGPILAIIGGTMLSCLISAVVWALGRSRTRAITLANEMTADLRSARDLAVRNSKELKASEAMLRRTGNMARVGGWELDLGDNTLRWSDEVYRIHDLPVGTPINVDAAIDFYAADARDQIRAHVERAIADGSAWDVELPLVTASGRKVFVRAQGEVVREGGRPVRLCGAFQDITQRKTAEDELRRSATHDKLTGLPNRALLTDRLQQCLHRATRKPSQAFAVLFMDFDRFKLTNDTLGHEAGDDLLKQIATRLRGCLRASDSVARAEANHSIVGRLGGDEFVVILDEIAAPEDAALVATRLLSALASPYQIFGNEVVSTASIGIVTSDAHYTKPEDMLRDADIAMYEAKAAGKGRYVMFDAAMYERIQRRAQLESDLRVALTSDQLSIAYQPMVSLTSGERDGVEALLRWQHPTLGIIAPDVVIPIAEECGLILPIGEWVMRRACEQLAVWQRESPETAPRSVSVNVSRKQLATSDLPTKVAAIVRDTGIRAECLRLEVTESAVMKDPTITMAQLTKLRAIGVKIDMDDFGTGQSSLATLHQFPIDALKIDRTFVNNLSRGREFVAIVHAIAQLARNLGITVIAEGVETAEQVTLLQSLDCDLAQGFYFGKPSSGGTVQMNDRLDRHLAA